MGPQLLSDSIRTWGTFGGTPAEPTQTPFRATLANQLGYMQAEQLHSVMRQHPIFAPVADHPRMSTYIKEFLSYFREDEPGEPTEEKAKNKAA